MPSSAIRPPGVRVQVSRRQRVAEHVLGVDGKQVVRGHSGRHDDLIGAPLRT